MPKIVILVLALAVSAGVLFWKFGPDLTQRSVAEKEVTLTFWGLWEDENLIRPAIDAYKSINPKVTISYNFQSTRNYRSRVQTQIANNQGPDIFMIHNSWVPMFLKTNTLSSAPDSVINFDDYSKTFYPIVSETLTQNKKIYAFPRGIDGLALFVNEDILKAAGVAPPQSWEQFVDAAVKTTVIDTEGKIKTAGAAMGTTGNVDHWPEIIGLLFLQQPGASLERPNSAEGAEVLKFYTDFVLDPNKKVWDASMESSTQAFASGRLAFYFAPSWRAYELRVANPQLNFKVVPVPQLPGKVVAWGTFWGYAVAANSTSQKQAWEFIKFLTTPDVERLLYQQAAQIRLLGLPYSRISMQKELISDPIVGAFVAQAPFYKSWYLSSHTFDAGVNDEMINYYEDAINATLQGQSPLAALQITAQGVAQVLDKYTGTQPAIR